MWLCQPARASTLFAITTHTHTHTTESNPLVCHLHLAAAPALSHAPQTPNLLPPRARFLLPPNTPTPTPSQNKSTSGAPGPIIDPQFSPDGRSVAFVQHNELYAMRIPDASPAAAAASAASALNAAAAAAAAAAHHPEGTPVQLTFNANETEVTHGLADFLAQEEMDRYRGFWWSNDGKRIAYVEGGEEMGRHGKR